MDSQPPSEVFEAVEALADALRPVVIHEIRLGAFRVPVERTPAYVDWDYLEGQQVYTVSLGNGRSATLLVRLAPAQNKARPELWYAKLMCGGRGRGFGLKSGTSAPIFSINLTTSHPADETNPDGGLSILPGLIFTGQHALAEEFGSDAMTNSNLQSQLTLLSVVETMGFDVTSDGSVSLGVFDPRSRRFLEPDTPEEFLNSFLAIALLKGHLQGNKKYRLPAVPYYGSRELAGMFKLGVMDSVVPTSAESARVQASRREERNVPQRRKEAIKARDGYRCVKCGRGPGQGVRLHVDHISPIAAMERGRDANGEWNLQTLCHLCNLGKSAGSD